MMMTLVPMNLMVLSGTVMKLLVTMMCGTSMILWGRCYWNFYEAFLWHWELISVLTYLNLELRKEIELCGMLFIFLLNVQKN